MSKKIVLIDGHSILNRAFYGVPELTNAQGLHTNGVYGFLNIMFKILDEEQPEYLAVAFDVHAPTFRHKIYAEYKGTRKGMPDELREQVPVIKDVLKAMNIQILEHEGYEADDILGTIAKRAEKDGMDVSLVSGDRDLLQIASDRIKIRIPKTKMGKTQIEDYNTQEVINAYHVTPLQFIDLKALMGDTADNIPGVPKVGEKTAMSLMEEYGSLENIYAHVEEITKNSIRQSLIENKELADLSKVLATIKTDCDIEFDYEHAKAEGFFTPEAYNLFKKLEFRNMLSKFDFTGGTDRGSEDEKFVLLSSIADCINKFKTITSDGIKKVGLYVICDRTKMYGVAVSLGDGDTFCYFTKSEAENEIIKSELITISSDSSVRIATCDIKSQYSYLSQNGTDNYFDVVIGAYLLNPLKNDYDVESIASEYLNTFIPGTKEVFGKQTIAEAIENNVYKCLAFFGYCSYVALKAMPIIADRLNETGMLDLFRNIEMPLTLVLYDMEKEGVIVKRDALKEYGEALSGRIEELDKSIHEAAGVEFNINSPKQLGEVLFENLKLPGAKKTKTGYSTSADVLEKLAGDYKIVRDILEYRGLTKLKSTYADGLANYIGDDNRIHTNYNQTITATGRISSTEPNLQNIPMRMELGRQIRRVFVPREGCVFMDADYSQIELRVMAHLSGDEQLIDAYKLDQDIHKITASKVFHTPLDQVTDIQRRNAKAVNFGIIYGISSFGLSQDLNISRKEATEYIEQYFKTYPKVKKYIDTLVTEAKEKGYITTMYNRRRPVPELASSNFMQRSFGERIAMNSPIQGTAADIIKIAMIKVYNELKARKLKSKLILQVHDELLIETYLEEEEEVRQILSENMKNAADLKVELAIDLHTGNDWYEAK